MKFICIFVFIFFNNLYSDSLSDRLLVLDSIVESAIQNRIYPGAQLLVYHKDAVVYKKNFGMTQYDDNKTAVNDNTLYDVASLSKVVVTLPLILQLVQEKKISLNDPLNKFYPFFRGKHKDKVLIKDILSHYAGFKPYYLLGEPEDTYQESKAKMLNYFLTHDLEYKPLSRVRYSGFGFSIFGDLIEKMSFKPLDELAKQRIFDPLEMHDSYFNPSKELWHNIAATEIDITHNRGLIKGTVHDPNTYFLHGVAGNAGLFSNATDIMKFGRMILAGGEFNEKRILSTELINLSKQLQARYKNHHRGLGWQLKLFGLKHSFGHTGYTGTVLYFDDNKQYMVVFLSNRVHPTRDTPQFSKHRKFLFQKINRAFYWPDWLWQLVAVLDKVKEAIFIIDK